MNLTTAVAVAAMFGRLPKQRNAGQYIVYRKTDVGVVYWVEGGWSERRADASHMSAAEANAIAEREKATAVKR